MTPSRIAVIDPVGSKAGMDSYDTALLSALSNQNVFCFLFSNFNLKQEKIKCFTFFNNLGVAKWKSIISNITGFIRSLIYCRQHSIKVVIIHIFRAGIFDLTMLAVVRLLKLKPICIIHDIESLDTKVLSVTRNIILKHLTPVKIVHNKFCYQQLIILIGEERSPEVHIIPHGNFIDALTSFRFARESSIEYLSHQFKIPVSFFQKPVLLFFGQIKKVKGLDVLIKALPHCKTDFNLIIAGKLRNEKWEYYNVLIQQQKINERILSILHYLKDVERNHLFNSTQAIILPYRKVYQSGVLITAMSWPQIIIASDLEPNKEIITDGKNGFLFDSGNSTALAEKIDEALNQVNHMVIKNNAYESVTSKHDWNKIALQYIKLL